MVIQTVKSWIRLLFVIILMKIQFFIQKEEYGFDRNGNQILKILYGWNSDLNEWNPYVKHEYTYDNAGNKVVDIVYTGIQAWMIG